MEDADLAIFWDIDFYCQYLCTMRVLTLCIMVYIMSNGELFNDYNVTRLPPAGMVKRKKPPIARRVQITSSVKSANNNAAVFSS